MRVTEIDEEMTVAELREALEGLSADAVVFLEFKDATEIYGEQVVWRDNRLCLCLQTKNEEVTA